MRHDFEKLELRETSSFDFKEAEPTFGSSSRRKLYIIAAVLVVAVLVALTVVGVTLGLHDNSDSPQLGAHRDNVDITTVTPLSDVNTTSPAMSSTQTSTQRNNRYQPVVLVSLDGFRASYLSYNVTPNIQQLIREGVHTPRLLPVYPTLTFPNHYTIATGLYPESHGIVDNEMYDVNFRRQYSLESLVISEPEWYSGEPIWLTAQRQGKRSACYFWVGSDVPIGGQYPNTYRKYNGSVPFNDRVDTVLEWLSLPADQRPDLVTLYFDEPDLTGHAEGPGPGQEMLSTLGMVDNVVGRLMTGLRNRSLYNDVNLLLLSDHGMSDLSCSRQVKLGDYFSSAELRDMYVYNGAAGRISNQYTYSRRQFTVLDTPKVSTDDLLQRLSRRSPHMALYNKRHLPKRLHYANNIRIDDIVIHMDDEWVVSRYGSSGSACSGGDHGWDSRYQSMSALFVAHGPAFREGVEVPPFENIELYNLMADLLNITAAPNNGTRGSLDSMLKNPPSLETLHRGEHQCAQQAEPSVSDLRDHCNCSVAQNNNLLFQSQLSDLLQPVWSGNQSTLLCLSASDHTTLYNTQLHMPRWTSFTVTEKQDILQDNISCIVPDSSLPADEREMYKAYTNETLGVATAALFASASSCGNIALSSNVLPMMQNLKEDLWQELWNMVRTVANSSMPSVSVTVGPLFDYDYDGHADDETNITRSVDGEGGTAMPSHYFVVLGRCPQAGQQLAHCVGHLDLLSFVLPNEQSSNRQTAERRLMENVARVRDIELLTGLRFFPDLDPALSAQLRTHIATSLWTKPGSWMDDLDSPLQPAQCPSSIVPVLLVSLDGFRADYLVKYNRTPVIDKLIRHGVHAPYMRSVYPTVTFPNHYTIVTGLYPESHGIIDNNMYDFSIGKKFCLSCDDLKNPAWWGGEPIWLTAKRQGRRTATYFWPGSDVAIQGDHPDYYVNYTGGVSFTERVHTVLQWLKLPAERRPDFLTLYFDEPDHTGHQVGPDSPQIGDKLAEVDAAIGELMQGLYQQDLHRCINIIIVADHGMSGLSCDRLISLSADISRADLGNMYVYDGPVGRISNKYRYGRTNNYPVDPPKVNITTILNRLECSDAHMRVYTKASLPLRHHYTNNRRIDDILLDADDQWIISRSGSTRSCRGGNHGYDNLYASMHALFVAYGPAFKSGMEVDPFENIELYNLMADLLEVTPAPNNGTEGSLFDVLREPPPQQGGQQETQETPHPCGNETGTLAVHQDQQEACNCSRAASKNVSDWRSPLGDPVASTDGHSLCVNYRSDYTLAYDDLMMAPAWIAFNVNLTNSTRDMSSVVPCVVRDSWMSSAVPLLNATFLEGTGFIPGSLLFGFDEPCGAVMASEVVPMLADFKTGIWKEVEEMVADYSVLYGEIAVLVGPVYNDDATALWQGRTNNTRLVKDTFPVPTHFFLILGKCATAEQSLPCWDSIELLSFLIPHVAIPTNCQSFSDMLRENVARVRDIEIATGLQFFSVLTMGPSAGLRTFLPTQVWKGSRLTEHIPKPGHWIEQECPPRDRADTLCPNDYKPVLLVSLDGFKPQYLGRGLTPVIDRLVTCGVHAPYMRSVYPTKTFPNHYTIVTGLYPESHGIVDNNMFDFSISNEKFKISSNIKNDPRWWGGEPIWITAQKQNRTSASYFWVGSDVPVSGSYPSIFKYYSGSVPYSSRVSTVVEWMRLPADRRPDLLLLYFDEPDHQAHTSGPFTPEVDAEVRRVDGMLGELMDGLYQHDLHHCVNLILLSDHGFSSLSCDQVIELDHYFNQTEKDELYFYLGPFARISNTYTRLENGSVFVYPDTPPMSIHDVQQHLQCVDHMKVYAKTDLPKRHHFVHNDRIDDIILDPSINWTVSDKVNRRYCTGGSHGWDNIYRAMEALFVGYGPSFKNGETVQAFENIELYNMISGLLDIEPAPNNGTEGSLDHLLWQTFNRTRHTASSYYDGASFSANVTTTSTCHCTLDSAQSVDSIVQALTSQNVSEVRQSALPFGAPLLMTSGMRDVTLLYQPTYVTAYNSARHLPLWVSASVTPSVLKGNVSTVSCAVEDTRLSGKRQCEYLQQQPGNVSYVSLLPLAYELGATASLLSSHIPMREVFYTGVWQTLQMYLGNWSVGYQDLNVLAGPAFDVNSDGLADTLNDTDRLNISIPTHVFVIATRCANSSRTLERCSSIQTLTFILPQVDTSQEFNCQTMGDYLVDNEARVRDVELLTGLQFFPSLPFSQAVAMRTYLPSGLWPL